MTNIKSTISFDEFNAVVEKVVSDCFPFDTYSPAYYDLSLRTALILTYAPEFELNDENNNTLYECVYTDEACKIIDEVKKHKQYYDIETAIRNGINFRKDMITSGGMSMSDIALSKFIDKITEITEKLEDNFDSVIDTESLKKFIDTVNNTQNGFSAENVLKALCDAKILNKSSSKSAKQVKS